MSRVELYAAIRRDARTGLSNRALQRKYKVGYRTVAAALDSAWPKQRKPPPKRGSRLDAYYDVIDTWLRDDLHAPRKQRHTAKRISTGFWTRTLAPGFPAARRAGGDRQPATAQMTIGSSIVT